jgi:hypothetical protein
MIKIHKYSDGRCIAAICDGDEPRFDVFRELEQQERFENGSGIAPPPPYDKYGPGGYRIITNDTVFWAPRTENSLSEAVKFLQRKTLIRGAKKRVENARKRLEAMQRRLDLLAEEHRLFDAETGEEIKI